MKAVSLEMAEDQINPLNGISNGGSSSDQTLGDVDAIDTALTRPSNVSKFLDTDVISASQTVHRSLRDFLLANKDLYFFFCRTAIIWPRAAEGPKVGTRTNFRYRAWVSFLYLCSLALLAYLIVMAIVYSASHDSVTLEMIEFSVTYGLMFQLLLIPPGIYYIQRLIDAPAVIIIDIYREAFDYAMVYANRLRWCLYGLVFIYAVVINLVYNYNYPIAFVGNFFATGLMFGPLCVFLIGMATFLVAEQRVMLKKMDMLLCDIQKNTLTVEDYFLVRTNLSDHNRDVPVNILVFTATANTILFFIIVYSLVGFPQSPLPDVVAFLSICVIVGRQTLVLFTYLLEVSQVNTIAEECVTAVARHQWKGRESHRISIYIALKEFPLGSKVFGFRPTKGEIFFQLGSTVVGILLAIFWALVFA